MIPARRLSLGAANRQLANEAYGIERMVERHRHLMVGLIQMRAEGQVPASEASA